MAAAPPTASLLPHLRAAKDLMDSAYAQPIDLDALAARAHCSRFHFLRSFRAAYGETPGAYLTRRRIERAKDLLRSANLTVTEVCFLVGFASLGSFSARALVTLHVWLWYHNPSGIYSGTNPLVTPFNGS